MGGLTQESSKWSNRRSAYSPRTGYASSRLRMSIVLTQKLIWDVANLEFLRPSLAPCLGHDGLYEAVSSPVASYENGKMGRWYLATGPFFFSVVLGSADLPRDPLLKKQPTLDCCWSEEHEPRVVLEFRITNALPTAKGGYRVGLGHSCLCSLQSKVGCSTVQ